MVRAWWVLIGIFVLCCVIGLVIAPPAANQGFADVGSVLGFATLVAVGIERVIEASYIALAGKLGQWWPLSVVRDQFATFETQTNALLGPVLAPRRGHQALQGCKDQRKGVPVERPSEVPPGAAGVELRGVAAGQLPGAPVPPRTAEASRVVKVRSTS